VSELATVRPYAAHDLAGCRALWTELTGWHRELYADPAIGGADPGRGFDAYLADAHSAQIWVAERDGVVVGLAGLLLNGEKGELEPIVVSGLWRRRGVGRLLAETAVTAARELGLRQVFVRPVGRNADAIRFFHALGFDVLGRVDLRLDLDQRSRHPGERVAGREFSV
jgi:N-acetylglutamate synthase-like GNAT family acetyltransferase